MTLYSSTTIDLSNKPSATAYSQSAGFFVWQENTENGPITWVETSLSGGITAFETWLASFDELTAAKVDVITRLRSDARRRLDLIEPGNSGLPSISLQHAQPALLYARLARLQLANFGVATNLWSTADQDELSAIQSRLDRINAIGDALAEIEEEVDALTSVQDVYAYDFVYSPLWPTWSPNNPNG